MEIKEGNGSPEEKLFGSANLPSFNTPKELFEFVKSPEFIKSDKNSKHFIAKGIDFGKLGLVQSPLPSSETPKRAAGSLVYPSFYKISKEDQATVVELLKMGLQPAHVEMVLEHVKEFEQHTKEKDQVAILENIRADCENHIGILKEIHQHKKSAKDPNADEFDCSGYINDLADKCGKLIETIEQLSMQHVGEEDMSTGSNLDDSKYVNLLSEQFDANPENKQ